MNGVIIDNACHKIKQVSLPHILLYDGRTHFSRELDNYCNVRREIFIERIAQFCEQYSNRALVPLYIHRRRQYYQYAGIFRNEIQLHMASELESKNFQILTDTDIKMTSEIIMADSQTNIHFFQVPMISNRNKSIHIDILNNTFHKVHLYLDNSRISAHIKDNVFTAAGITISSISADSHQPVILENNIFQGNKAKTVLEVRDTTNVIMSSSAFQHLPAPFITVHCGLRRQFRSVVL